MAGVASSTTVISTDFRVAGLEREHDFRRRSDGRARRMDRHAAGPRHQDLRDLPGRDVWKGRVGAVTQLEFLGGTIGEDEPWNVSACRHSASASAAGSTCRATCARPVPRSASITPHAREKDPNGVDRVRTYDGRSLGTRRDRPAASQLHERGDADAAAIWRPPFAGACSPEGAMSSWHRRTLGLLTIAALVGRNVADHTGFSTLGSTGTAAAFRCTCTERRLGPRRRSANFNASFSSRWRPGTSPQPRAADRRQSVDGGTRGRRPRQPGLLRLHLLRQRVRPRHARDHDAWTLSGTHASKPTSSSAAPSRSTPPRQRPLERCGISAASHCTSSATPSVLDHPDERGQAVTALMNSILGNLDSLTADEQSPARSRCTERRHRQHQLPAAQRANAFFTSLIRRLSRELRAQRHRRTSTPKAP